jgi:hypothetical protein
MITGYDHERECFAPRLRQHSQATVHQTVAATESHPMETHPDRYLIKVAIIGSPMRNTGEATI